MAARARSWHDMPTGTVAISITLLALSHALDLKLELASVLFRHGDRSPTHTYPKDPYQEPFWPQGFGQLSTEGMRQEYFLGEILRKRYIESNMQFIHHNYTRVQIYVRSTDYDRTLMSAESVLAALFPPGQNQKFNSTLPWQPIPVHTLPQDEDNVLLATNVDCPTYRKLREEDTKTQAYINLEKENKEFFQSLEKETGYEMVNLTNVHSIYGVLFVEQTLNLTLPKWVNATLMARLLNLTLYTDSLRFNSLTKKQLIAGNWVGKVVSDMKTRKDDPEDQMRLYLYSAHDTTVAAMMTALGVYNGLLPPYVATLFTELYSDNNSEYWVSLFYRNETDSDYLWPLNVDSCDNTTLCSLEEFSKLTAPLIPADWKKECGLGSQESEDSDSGNPTVSFHASVTTDLAVLLVMCVLLLVVGGMVCTVVLCRSSKSRPAYIKLHNLQFDHYHEA